jgi:hypothetical protein
MAINIANENTTNISAKGRLKMQMKDLVSDAFCL